MLSKSEEARGSGDDGAGPAQPASTASETMGISVERTFMVGKEKADISRENTLLSGMGHTSPCVSGGYGPTKRP